MMPFCCLSRIFCETENHFIVNTVSNNLYVDVTLGTISNPVADDRIKKKVTI